LRTLLTSLTAAQILREPVAVIGAESQTAILVAVGSSQPVLCVEFRKDGAPVDPSPWWANDSEKVRG